MLASKFLKDEAHSRPPGFIMRLFERGFDSTLALYTRTLDFALAHRYLVLAVALATFVATAWLFVVIPKGFFPQEDIGQIQITTEAAEDTSFTDMVRLQERVAYCCAKIPMFEPSVHSMAGLVRKIPGECSSIWCREANVHR